MSDIDKEIRELTAKVNQLTNERDSLMDTVIQRREEIEALKLEVNRLKKEIRGMITT